MQSQTTSDTTEEKSDLIFKFDLAYAWLRFLRQTRGLSLREVESMSGVAHSEIQKIETGKQECRLSSFVRICDCLGMPSGWVVDLVVQSNSAAFARFVEADPGFEMLLESLQIKDKTAKDAVRFQLVAACVLTSILLRVSSPSHRAAFHHYPSVEWRESFLSFAGKLESRASDLDRIEVVRALRKQPVATLRRLGLLPRSSLEEKRDDLKNPKPTRRGGSFGGELYSLTFQEVAVLLGVQPSAEKLNLPKTATHVSDAPMQGKWPALKRQLQAATEKTGKSALARFLGVDLTRVSQWLTDAKSQREPGAEYALQMQDWLKRQKT